MKDEMIENEKSFKSQLNIKFPSNSQALIVKSCLEVDDELQPQRLSRSLIVNDTILEM